MFATCQFFSEQFVSYGTHHPQLDLDEDERVEEKKNIWSCQKDIGKTLAFVVDVIIVLSVVLALVSVKLSRKKVIICSSVAISIALLDLIAQVPIFRWISDQFSTINDKEDKDNATWVA